VIARSIAVDLRKRPSSRPLVSLDEVQVPTHPDDEDQIADDEIEEVRYLFHHFGLAQNSVIAEDFRLFTPPENAIDELVELRILCDVWLARLISYHEQFEATVPRRSHSHHQYRHAIVAVAKQLIWAAIYERTQDTISDLLKAAYPGWLDEPGVTSHALYTRMSRARRDLRELLQTVVRPEELTEKGRYTGNSRTPLNSRVHQE
jgi:hypothetical protein